MSVKDCLEYAMERRDLNTAQVQKQSRMVDIDKKLEELRLKRELDDGGELLGVNLTSMSGASVSKSKRATEAKNKFKILGIEVH